MQLASLRAVALLVAVARCHRGVVEEPIVEEPAADEPAADAATEGEGRADT